MLRSDASLKTYGPNVNILLRPDSQIFVVQTALGYLITYSLATDPTSRVYKTQFAHTGGAHSRRQSAAAGFRIPRQHGQNAAPGDGVLPEGAPAGRAYPPTRPQACPRGVAQAQASPMRSCCRSTGQV